MLEPDCFPTEERELAERLKLERYEIQQKHDQEYQDALIREKENVILVRQILLRLINY